jgi:hypothetical protein
MSVTRWTDLRAFIDARAPAYWSATKGVPRDDIAACEEAAGVKLPRLYVDFLADIGAESGDLEPFGGFQACGFDRIKAELPARGYPGSRYFKVAIEEDTSQVTLLDTFLDLARSDGHDALLVQFEDIGSFDEEMVTSRGFTLAEQLARSVFDFVELEPRPHKTSLGIYNLKTPEDVERQRQLLFQQLANMGLTTVLPPEPRVACFHGDKLSALVEFLTEIHSFGVTLGAVDKKAAKVAVEQLRDHVPEMLVDD